MSFLAGQSAPERTDGESDQIPVTKFDTMYQNVNNMLLKTDTLGLEQFAITKFKKAFDDSPQLSDDDIDNFNSEVPGLSIPYGTRQDTAKTLMSLQIQKNLASSVASAPQSDSIVGGLGKTIGFVGGQFDPVDTVAALPVAGVAGKGAALVGKALLPESLMSLKYLPEALKPYVGAGVDGGIFGGSLGLVSGEIQSKTREAETGQQTPTTDIIKESLEGIPFGFAGGAALYGIGSIIGKGLGFATSSIEKAGGSDVIQAEQTAQSRTNLQQLLENRQNEIAQDKALLQSKVDQIRQNQSSAADLYVPNGNKIVNDVSNDFHNILDIAKNESPENKTLDRIDSSLSTIEESTEPHNIKAQALTQINEDLRNYAAYHPDVIDNELSDTTSKLTSYFDKANSFKPNDNPDSIENILNEFRMTTADDYKTIRKTAISQMEQGREAQVEPYINDSVYRNSENLINRIEAAGIDREKTIHAALDSLDVVKEDQNKIQGQIEDLDNRIKGTSDLDEKNKLNGQIAGLQALLRTKTDQRAVHEVIISSLANEFKQTPKDAVKGYLLNQLSKDADFRGGYKSLENQLRGIDLEELKERPAPVSAEGKEEAKVIEQRKSLSSKLVEDAYNCLLGK